jgi:hypothetical protein
VSNVKKYNLISGLFAAMLLFSSLAGADQKYPASDFQPTVVYQDDDYIAKSGQSKPTSAASNNQSASNAASQSVDSKYPAANFQPKVVYNDPDYKHTQQSVSAGSNAQSGSSVSSTAETDSSNAKEGDSSSNYLIGLVLFAAVGFVLFKRRSEPKAQASSRVYGKDSTGLTGVARYLNRSSGTGVARYLEKQVKAASAGAATGVAKYMAKQSASEKTTAKEAKTGVEKYMRNRG